MTVRTSTGQALRALTPAEDRARRKVAWKRVVRSLLAEHDVSQAQLALDLGLAPAQLQRQLDVGSDNDHLRLADIEALPPVVRRAVVARLADTLGCIVADAPAAAEDGGCDITLIAQIAREAGDVVSKQAEACADGRLHAAEAADVRREVDELMRVLVRARERLLVAEREGVVSILRRG